jgi:ABC-type Zn uptake system ZnuABC Zn-binding protein ZnuA
MQKAKVISFLCSMVALVVGLWIAPAAASADEGRLLVAVAEPDIETIVMAVGGTQVDTFSLFKGCICRNNLLVESAVTRRLAKADVVVWTGFLNESAAINDSLKKMRTESSGAAGSPVWINVSKGAARTNIPTSTCFDYVNAALVQGDPFFWLNPRNGSVIARNIASGLGDLQPERRAYFLANAAAFKRDLDADINRWKQQLSGLSGLRVFSTQCGWQNFSSLGGPHFVVYKKTPGSLPKPNLLFDEVKQMHPQVVVVDPNTPPEYEKTFREELGFKVIEVSSSIETIPGAKSYSALFDNLVQALLKSAQELKSNVKS